MWEHLVAGLASQARRADLSVVIAHGVSSLPFVSLAAGLELMTHTAPPEWRLGRLLNFGLEAAFSRGADVACIWDDDDWYGPGYLASVERALAAHPDAWLIGKHAFRTRWPEEPARSVELFEAPISVDGRCRWLAGPTVSIVRGRGVTYREDVDGPVDWRLLQDAAEKSGGEEWPPFYSTGAGDFVLQRFGKAHEHHWADPR